MSHQGLADQRLADLPPGSRRSRYALVGPRHRIRLPSWLPAGPAGDALDEGPRGMTLRLDPALTEQLQRQPIAAATNRGVRRVRESRGTQTTARPDRFPRRRTRQQPSGAAPPQLLQDPGQPRRRGHRRWRLMGITLGYDPIKNRRLPARVDRVHCRDHGRRYRTGDPCPICPEADVSGGGRPSR